MSFSWVVLHIYSYYTTIPTKTWNLHTLPSFVHSITLLAKKSLMILIIGKLPSNNFKPQDIYRLGIHLLPERLQEFLYNNGVYPHFLGYIWNYCISSFSFLSLQFSHLTVNNIHTVKTYFESVHKLKIFSSFDCIMLLTDVKSSFINVPTDGAICCLEKN